MKNLYSKNEFLNLYEKEQRLNDEIMNEGLFQFLGKMFNKAKTYIKKISGAQEVEDIYNKYIKIIDDEFKKKAQVDLGLTADEQLNGQKEKETGKPVEKPNPKVTTESVKVRIKNRLNEAGEADVIKSAEAENVKDTTDETENSEGTTNLKMTADALKKKQVALQNILNLYQKKAIVEMERVLAKKGGREKNPKLAIIIDNKKDEFRLAFLNAEINAFEKGGDKSSAQKLALERNKLVKDLDVKWQNLDKATTVDLNVKIDGKDVKLTVGKPYRYKKDDGTISSIEIKGKSTEDGKVVAAYRSGDSAGEEQSFRLDNIEIEFAPEVNKEYNYYSKDAKKDVKVKVDSFDDITKLATVHIGDVTDKTFKVNIGALMDVSEEENKDANVQSKEQVDVEVDTEGGTQGGETEKVQTK